MLWQCRRANIGVGCQSSAGSSLCRISPAEHQPLSQRGEATAGSRRRAESTEPLAAAPLGPMLRSRIGAQFRSLTRCCRAFDAASLSTVAGGLSVGKRSFAPDGEEGGAADASPRPAEFAMPRWEPIRELDPSTMTAERMRAECIDAEQPAVLRGVAADWPAVSGPRAWADWDRLGKLYGHNMVSVEQGEVFYAADALAGMRVPFGLYLIYMHEAAKPEVLAQMHSQLPKMYLGQVDLFADVPEMRDDVKLPDFA